MTAAAMAADGWHLACTIGDVPANVPLAVEVAGVPVAIVWAEGKLYAIHDMCSHENIPLSEGEVDDTAIECWLHGSRFDLETGDPSGLPAIRPVPVYPVMIEGSGSDAAVFVDLSVDTAQES